MHLQDRMLENTVGQLMDRLLEFRNGNTALLEALMLTCWQKPEAEAAVRKVLTEAGLLTDAGPDWAALEARKATPWAWDDAVVLLVKDPAERDRLLNMRDGGRKPGVVTINDTFSSVAEAAEYLVAVAASRGQMLRIEQQPLQPLAMKNDTTVVTVWSR